MEFEPTAIPEVVLIKPKVFADARGHFFESWTERKFAQAGLDLKFVQDNQNRSERHVLRGLHYQLAKPQGKLVRVVTGAVFDVAVDLRRSSPTFGRWVGAELTADNHHMLWVPPPGVRARLRGAQRVGALPVQVHRVLLPRGRTGHLLGRS